MKMKVQEKGLSNNMQEYVVQNLAPRYHVELALAQFLLAALRGRQLKRDSEIVPCRQLTNFQQQLELVIET